MDHQKILRMLRLLMKLSGRRWCSLQEVADILQCSQRTVYRYLETFESAGFLVERNDGKYRLQSNSYNRSLQSLLYFSAEEVAIIYETLELIEGTTSVKEQLIRKLNVLYDFKALEQLQKTNDLAKIHTLSEAIKNKKQVHLKKYRSSNSDNISDRKVEPFDFSPDYRSVWCFELDSKSCKQFKLSRIQDIELTNRNWENEMMHHIFFTDAFRIAAIRPLEKIEATLSLKAYNLLVEEYPLSRECIEENKGSYHLKIPVSGYQGIGRFVLGLPGEIEVLGTKGFKKYLEEEIKKFAGLRELKMKE